MGVGEEASSSVAGIHPKMRDRPSEREAGPLKAAVPRDAYWKWTITLALVYALGSLFLSVLRFRGFYDEQYDLGIFQQALWTGAHGGAFYESGDLQFLGIHSFLQVHPSLMMFPLAGIYFVAPSAYTLFAIQSTVVGFAAVPLFLLTQHLTGSGRKALWCVLCYLTWVPLLSSQLYDVHLEAFMPIELFSTFYLWIRGRYRWTVLSAFVSMLTLEVAPLFVLAMAIFFFVPGHRALGDWLRRLWSSLGHRADRSSGTRGVLGELWRYLRRPAATFCLVMLNLAIGTYLLLRLIQGPWISLVTGGEVTFSGTVWGISAGSLHVAPQYLSQDFSGKIYYWLTIYALVLFVPLLKPRALVIQVPWLVYTFFSSYPEYVKIGYQYGMVAAVAVFIGMAYGLQQLDLAPLRSLLRLPPHEAPHVTRRPESSSPWAIGIGARAQTAALLGVVVFGLVASPLNPWLQDHVIPEGTTPGYWLKYSWDPAFDKVTALAGQIPSGAEVLATSDLFPIVANDPNAYSTLWYPGNPIETPFNVSHPPEFVFVAAAMAGNVPYWLQPMLQTPSEYGVLGEVPSTPLGPVVLYEHGYMPSASAVDPHAPMP